MVKYLFTILLIITINYGATCYNHSGMSEYNQRIINQDRTGGRYFLRYSFYYGDFYGNNETCLLSPRKFSETIYLEGIDGKPILPGSEKGIIPFNTEVMIEKIEFPPANRPILTPRFYPWVYIRVDGISGYRNCIVVIRPDVSNPEEFTALFNEIFSKDSFDSYLKGLNSEIRDAIYRKRFVENLSSEEVVIVFGKPDSIYYKKENINNIAVFDYRFFRVILKDGKTIKYEEVGDKK